VFAFKIHHVVILNIFNVIRTFINIILLFSNKCFILFFLHDKKTLHHFLTLVCFLLSKHYYFCFVSTKGISYMV
jgi:hypothetical protein